MRNAIIIEKNDVLNLKNILKQLETVKNNYDNMKKEKELHSKIVNKIKELINFKNVNVYQERTSQEKKENKFWKSEIEFN